MLARRERRAPRISQNRPPETAGFDGFGQDRSPEFRCRRAVALETTFDPARAAALPGGPASAEPRSGGGERRYQVNLGEHGFAITVAGRAIDVARGQVTDPLLTLNTDPVTLTARLWAELPVEQACREGRLRVDGEPTEAGRFLTLFPAPVPAAAE
jgi:hypothetical protein